MRVLSIALLLGVTVTAADADPFSPPAEIVDFRTLPSHGVRLLTDFSGAPTDGLLQSWRVALPAYRAGCYFSSDDPREPGGANRVLPWMFGADLGELFRTTDRQNPAANLPSRRALFALFQLESGEVLALLPMAGPDTVSWLDVDGEGGLTLQLGTFGTAPVKTDAPLVAWARATDAYAAVRQAWAAALASPAVAGRTDWRAAKTYPEPFRYLGWCSWEQYRKAINSDLLVEALTQLENGAVPVRWALIDDGHQQDRRDEGGGGLRLASFDPDPQKFPEGWRPLMELRRPDKLRWLGIWHAFLGLWGGIAIHNDFGADLNAHLMPGAKGGLLPAGDAASHTAFYEALIDAVDRHGFDFVKIDGQTFALRHYAGTANAVQASAGNSQALETAVQDRLKGLINCMAQNPICLFNTRNSAVTRCSTDYRMGDLPRARSHLMQSYANTLWLGQTVWPDHDMFHSSDPVSGRMMAVSKALSGAPIYLSDAPGDFVAEHIMPLCYADGELLRPLAPAVPLPDSVFAPALNRPQAYRVIAPLANEAAAVALYNLYSGDEAASVVARVRAADYRDAGALQQPWPGRWDLPAEGLVAFDWQAGEGRPLREGWATTLTGFSDRLVLLTPIRAGWSVIGRPDKYLSPAAVDSWSATADELTVTLHESGPLLIYSERRPHTDVGKVSAAPGEHIWAVALPKGQRNFRVTFRRS